MENALRLFFVTGLVAILLVSITGLFAFAIWQGDMITPFRVQLLTIAVIGLGLSFLFKDKRILGLAALVVAANLIPMAIRMAEFHRLPTVSRNANSLSLVSTNVLCDNRQYDRVLAMAAREHPDILVAVETSPAWIRALRPLEADYPYTLTPDIGIFGISIYAKQPFTAHVDRIGRAEMPLAELHFKDFTLFVAHPMPPATQRLAQENRLYLDTLAKRIKATREKVIIAGDFNATLWSHNLAPLIDAGIQWPHGSGLAYTWPTDRAQMAIQIDHVFTRGLRAGNYRVLPPVGSDHFPVRADLVF